MKLETKRLIIRTLEDRDARELVKNLNNLEVSKWLLTVPHPYTLKDAKKWIKHCEKTEKEKPRIHFPFVIERKSNLGIIGGLGISEIKGEQGTADLGVWLSPNYWEKGYAREGISRIINYCFDILKLRRLKIPAFATNLAGNSFAKKLGFTKEGCLRQAKVCKATGMIHDENIWGLLKGEWIK
jgi:RimJ/RimL family protein N-acetyltransferase